jgi:hypothetical protein
MHTAPNNARLPSAVEYLTRALEILDDMSETVAAAKVSDIIDLLNDRLTPLEG